MHFHTDLGITEFNPEIILFIFSAIWVSCFCFHAPSEDTLNSSPGVTNFDTKITDIDTKGTVINMG